MIVANIATSEERHVLQEHYKKGANQLIKERAHAVLLSQQNYHVPEIARILLRDEGTVRNWLKSWNAERMASLFPRYSDNQNAAKLTSKQKEEIEKALQAPNGLPAKFWSLPAFKDYIHAEFGVVYESERSYHYLLRYCGFSWKLPSPFDRRRNDDYVHKRMQEIRDEIKPYLESDEWVVLSSDETRIDYNEEIRRCWLPRGEKTILKVERDKKQKQHYFGALNLKSHQLHLSRLAWQDSDNIIQTLENLARLYPDKRICLLWDNAKWHKSQALREKLGPGGSLEQFYLINFPPYAPDENPQEHVWRYGKDQIRSEHFASFPELRDLFEASLTSRTYDYQI